MKKTASSALLTRIELAAALALGCAAPRAASDHAPESFVAPPRQEPVRLVLETAAGQHVDLADHRGKALLVLAFTTDNLASQAMVRTLERVARHHPESLAVIAIAGDQHPPDTLRLVLDTYRDVAALERVTLALASDEVRAGSSPLGEIERVPTLFFLNRAGVIVRRIDTMLSEAQVEALIAPAIPSGE
jgi:hypothetical protein